jgi:hypothetical protein
MSETKNIHLINAHSKDVINDGLMGKLPSVDRLKEGEMAINIKNGLENLSVKGGNGEIVPFILSINLTLDSPMSLETAVVKACINAKIVVLNKEIYFTNKTFLTNCVIFKYYDANIDKEHILTIDTAESTIVYTIGDEILKQRFSIHEGIETIIYDSDLESVNKKVGKLVYSQESGNYYSYSENNGWSTLTKFYVGVDEPQDKGVLWVDDDSNVLTSRENDELRYLRQRLHAIDNKVGQMETIFQHGIVPGNALFSSKSVMMSSSELEAPIHAENSSEIISLYTYNPNQVIDRIETYYQTTAEEGEPSSGDWTQTLQNAIVNFAEEPNLWFYNKIILNNGNFINTSKYKLCVYTDTKDLTDVFIYYCVTQDDSTVPEKYDFFQLNSGEEIKDVINETDKYLWCFLECYYHYEKPEISDVVTGTVRHNCVKLDAATAFTSNRDHLYDGELLFYTDRKKFAVYYDGQFFVPQGSGGSGEGGGQGISEDDLYNLPLDYLLFNNNGKNFQFKLTDKGKMSITEYSNEVNTKLDYLVPSWNVYVNHLLTFNTAFVGKEVENIKYSKSLCSHDCIELANASKTDVNLNGIYLLYTNCSMNSKGNGYEWEVLPLKGVINAESTFLIRGAQCRDYNSSFIKVDNFDMEWFDKNEKLIKFKEEGCFYLTSDSEILTKVENGFKDVYVNTTPNKGYIDLFGYTFTGGSVPAESSQLNLNGINRDETLLVRWFMMEPAKQGIKQYKDRKTSSLWTYIDLTKQPNGVSPDNLKNLYFNDEMKLLFTPKPSMANKNFFTIKSKFKDEKPNMIFMTLGINGTDYNNKGGAFDEDKGATRCFNWISVGYYDEYVYYKHENDDQWLKQYSFVDSDFNETNKILSKFYSRLRWCTADGKWVTTHKAIIKGLKSGRYEYYIKRDGDEKYTSEINTFIVKNHTDVNNFVFVQTSDQQGFNFQEYSVWERCSAKIALEENDTEFIVNTGDATQSGNRPSEWIDYYNGRKWIKHLPEMYSIGNNDLCGYFDTELTDGVDKSSKYNHINVRRYFTFEIDPNNIPIFDWEYSVSEIYKDCLIDSLYSFNYGKYHFISLNSEVAKVSSKTYRGYENENADGDESYGKKTYQKVEEWLIRDLENYMGRFGTTNCSKCVVYCHEMPFTIVTDAYMKNTNSERGGSKLNTLNENGTYRFSRLFYKYGIRLVMGGHKHTYSISKPIYDAPMEWNSGWTPDKKEFMTNSLTTSATRKPIIQVLSESAMTDIANCRYQVVEKITAPTYVMTQATGYKLVSNAELPSSISNKTPWLLSYFPCTLNGDKGEVNASQYHPTYVRYELTDEQITVIAKQVKNIWVDKKFNYNSQQSSQTIEEMTLSQISSEDKNNYGISETNKYIIKL